MAVYKIVELGDQVLREKAAPVPEVNAGIQRLLDNLADTMYAARGVGLAAPQIGVSKRAIVVDTGEGLVELVNPEITHRQGEDIDVEGCLSIPGVAGEVRRAAQVEVRGWNREGKSILVRGEGLLARALQHEIDHLDGVLFIDKVIRFIKTQET